METHYLTHLAGGYDRNLILEQLMDEFGHDVWSYAFFLTKQRQTADDIAQDVFLAAYESLYRYRGEGTVRGWLLTITRNRCYSFYKSSYKRKTVLARNVEPMGSAPSPEAEVLFREEAKEVWLRVMELPVRFREVLILDYRYGLSVKEIASVLNVTEGTVKSRSHRAKVKLSRMLAHGEERGR
ncbi:RNA polymerase sigma factor [Paenibacillus sp. NPDC058071]|uniref:RNA polymerase sigma factor n=1 Tax=Paenibacillus sp. NPDC058071 TaxID=3346326 RepID=UPI0036DBFF8D